MQLMWRRRAAAARGGGRIGGTNMRALLVALALTMAMPAGAQSIRGLVTNGKTAEAGVWVIAETDELPTRFAKIAVTDERGRFVIPDLPKATYQVWVRGYGLVDSKKLKAVPGRAPLRLKASVAPNEGSAAQYYPAAYWYAMLHIPEKSEFPIGKAASQEEWLDIVKTNGCISCHALGTAATRTVPRALGPFKSSEEAWARRITSGQAMTSMVGALARADTQRMLKQYADWTDRVAAGEVPGVRPPRPEGLERNVVITLWDSRNPEFCRKGSSHPSAQVLPLESANRHLSMFDPASGKFTLISTCFSTHHLVFAEDANQTLWTSAGGASNPALGWLNRKLFAQTGDEARAQGWTPFVLDTNGNGQRDEWVEPDQPLDPAKDKRVITGLYSVAVNPVDGTVWGTSRSFPGYVVRVNPGPDPARTALTEIYEPPLPGYGPRGGDIDRDGVFWSSLSSGHLASFDRRKCKGTLNGPNATGKQCPEGWTLYAFPGPQFRNVGDPGSVESSYYTWVDQFDTFGLGKNVPIATGNLNDALLALVDGKFVVLRVPYPLGYYTKWMDGRIDDAKKGWKGRGLWSTVSTRAPFHMEGGKGTRPKVVRFQLRPSPLAD